MPMQHTAIGGVFYISKHEYLHASALVSRTSGLPSS